MIMMKMTMTTIKRTTMKMTMMTIKPGCDAHREEAGEKRFTGAAAENLNHLVHFDLVLIWLIKST